MPPRKKLARTARCIDYEGDILYGSVISCLPLCLSKGSNKMPGTPGNPIPPPTSQLFLAATTLTTIPGPQLTTRYGPQPTSSPGTPTLNTMQGPQLTTRYTLPGMPSSSSSMNSPSVNRATPNPTQLPRTPSQTFYHHTAIPSVASPLSMPTGTGSAPLPTQQQFASAGGSLMLPTNAVAPSANAAANAAAAAASGRGGRKPMSLRGAFSKECTNFFS